MKHEMMRKHKEAQETMKEELRRNDGKSKQKRNFEEDLKAEKVARKSSDDCDGGGSDQHKLQAPVECDIPRTPTPDYADLNARFIKRLYFHVILGAQIVGLKISWV